MDAKALGYSTQLDSIAGVILAALPGVLLPTGFVPTDFTQSYHQLGLIGAMRAFTCSPRVDDDATAAAYRDSLLDGQLANGSWGLSYGGTFYEDDIQESPNFTTKVRTDFIAGMASAGDRFLVLLDIDKVLSPRELEDVDAAI